MVAGVLIFSFCNLKSYSKIEVFDVIYFISKSARYCCGFLIIKVLSETVKFWLLISNLF